MTNPLLNEEQTMFQQSIRKVLERHAPPEYVREKDEKEEFPRELYQVMAKEGWFAVPFPAEYGGAGGGPIECCILLEEISYSFRALASAFFTTVVFGGGSILAFGSEEQKKTLLPKVCRGEINFSLALTEPNAGSDAASVATQAVQKDGHYVVRGNKIFTTGAQVADYLIVVLRTDPKAPKRDGISILLVPSKAPGVTIRGLKKFGVRALDVNEIAFDDVKVPVANLLGRENRGWEHLGRTLEMERIGLAAESVGLGQRIVDDAARYARERVQFGKPISKFQLIQEKIVNMQIRVDAGRLLAYRAAHLRARGLPCAKEASMAKVFASEVSTFAALDGMQVLGGYGYMMEYDMQRHLRDAKLNEIGGGTNEIQRLIIAREMGL